MFVFFISVIVLQRIIELIIARNNEKWMKSRGAVEFGASHYSVMVIFHALFFVTFILEVVLFKRDVSSNWPLFLFLFMVTQAGRIWALCSLGRYWNTKILVLPNEVPVRRGPYRFIKHPNYLIVIIEFIVVPLMYNAFWTALIFTCVNAWILTVRIGEEEKALRLLNGYDSSFKGQGRFLPKMLK